MSRQIECHVRLWGKDVGMIVERDRRIYFQYEGTFLEEKLEVSPLHLPPSKKVYETTDLTYFEGLAGVFADALPDSWGSKIVENYFVKHKNILPYDISPLQKLLYMGSRAVGALEFFPSEEESDDRVKEILELCELVKESRKVLRGDIISLLPEVFRVSSDSLGGAKAKATVGLNVASNELITMQEILPPSFEPWLIKFDGTDENATPTDKLVAEKLYLDMAKMCGINTVEARLLEDRGLRHLAVKRFDREGNDKPLHMHTLAGLAHINFRDKTMMNYDKFFRTTLFTTKSYKQLEEAYRRMVFNVLVGNQDDHAKNHTFVMDKVGVWSLSPAYDLSPTFGYGHQMEINFKDKGVSHNDLIVMAERFDIQNARVILEEQLEVISHFSDYAKAMDLSQKKIDEIQKNFRVSQR